MNRIAPLLVLLALFASCAAPTAPRTETIGAANAVRVENEGPVTILSLGRPEKRNALSLELMEQIIAALHSVDAQVVVIRGEGPAFSAGHDLGELPELPKPEPGMAAATGSE